MDNVFDILFALGPHLKSILPHIFEGLGEGEGLVITNGPQRFELLLMVLQKHI